MTFDKNRKTAVALGYFDGLHMAHMAVISAALSKKKDGFCPSVLLFDEHPEFVLNGKTVPFIMQKEIRDKIFSELGVQKETVAFSDIMNKSPEEFIDDVLIKQLNAGFVACGFNYSFGKNRSGTPELLLSQCKRRGIRCVICSEVKFAGETVSSTRIRNLIAGKKISEANEMLYKAFSYISPITQGDKRGRTFGLPTVNQYLPKNLIIPHFGVYASEILIDGKIYPSVTNIGARPTFDSDLNSEAARSETFIIDFNGNLYGQKLEVTLTQFLRNSVKFDSPQKLIEQINKDIVSAKDVFKK